MLVNKLDAFIVYFESKCYIKKSFVSKQKKVVYGSIYCLERVRCLGCLERLHNERQVTHGRASVDQVFDMREVDLRANQN